MVLTTENYEKDKKGHIIKHGIFSANMGLSFYTYDNRDNTMIRGEEKVKRESTK